MTSGSAGLNLVYGDVANRFATVARLDLPAEAQPGLDVVTVPRQDSGAVLAWTGVESGYTLHAQSVLLHSVTVAPARLFSEFQTLVVATLEEGRYARSSVAAAGADGGKLARRDVTGGAPGTRQTRVRVATAKAGGSFGEPVTLGERAGDVFGPYVAIGSDGTAAVAWRPAGGALRVAVSLGGAAQFGPAELLSEQRGLLVVLGDGSVIAAAVVSGKLTLRERPPHGTFGAPQIPGIEATQISHLQVTPSGVLAAVLFPPAGAGNPAARIAIRPPGGAFGVEDVGTVPEGRRLASVSAAFDTGAGAYATWGLRDSAPPALVGDPAQSLHAAEIVAAARPPATVWGTPVVLRAGTDGIADSSVVAGPAGRALTYWQDSVGLEAAPGLPPTAPTCRSPPRPQPAPSVGSRPATKDTVAPRVAVRTTRLRLGRRLTLRLACNEPCNVKARASLVARQRTTLLRAVTRSRAARSQTRDLPRSGRPARPPASRTGRGPSGAAAGRTARHGRRAERPRIDRDARGPPVRRARLPTVTTRTRATTSWAPLKARVGSERGNYNVLGDRALEQDHWPRDQIALLERQTHGLPPLRSKLVEAVQESSQRTAS